MVDAELSWTGQRSELELIWNRLCLLEQGLKASATCETETVRVFLGGLECPKHFLCALATANHLPLRPVSRCDWLCVGEGYLPHGSALVVHTNATPTAQALARGPVLVLNTFQLRPDLLLPLLRRDVREDDVSGLLRDAVLLGLGGPRPPKGLRWLGLTPELATLLQLPAAPEEAPEEALSPPGDATAEPAQLRIKPAWPHKLPRGMVFARQPVAYAQAAYHEAGESLVAPVDKPDQVADFLFVPRVEHADCVVFRTTVLLDPEMSEREVRWVTSTRKLCADLYSEPCKGHVFTAEARVMELVPTLPAGHASDSDRTLAWPWQPLWARFAVPKRQKMTEAAVASTAETEVAAPEAECGDAGN
jgi:hypothetical protein